MTDRHALLLDRAGEFARVALTNVRREYPRDFRMTLQRPEPPLSRPRELNPAFYGCYDWHAVEMHWMLVRLLRVVPDAVPPGEIRALLDEHLTAEAIATDPAGRALQQRVQPAPRARLCEVPRGHRAAGGDHRDGQGVVRL